MHSLVQRAHLAAARDDGSLDRTCDAEHWIFKYSFKHARMVLTLVPQTVQEVA